MKISKLIIGIAMLCLPGKLLAQPPDTSTLKKLIHYVLQPLDKSQVPTGFLEEWGCPILPMATFNGTLTDSNRIDMNLWRTLYFQLQTAYCQTGTNPLPVITTANDTIRQNMADTLAIPIPILISQYNNVKSYAFSSNLLYHNTGTNQVQDVGGRPENPYQANNLFAACPNEQRTINGREEFVCQSNLIWNTTGKTIHQIQVDFDNTLGFKNITIGTPITVSYADTGSKRWTIKVKFTDSSVLQCYSDYKVLKADSVNYAARYHRLFFDDLWGIPASANHPGGRVFVRYSRLNASFTLRKPLVVVEGYDVSRAAPNLQENYTYTDFIDAINEPLGFDFNGNLDDIAGYDLLFVDYNDGTADITENAALVEDILESWVNANKVLDNRFGNILQQNVVMGLSMGGLVARYALADMTKNSIDPETPFIDHT